MFRRLRSVLEVVGGGRRAGPAAVDLGAALVHVGRAVGSQVRAVVRVAAAHSLATAQPQAPRVNAAEPPVPRLAPSPALAAIEVKKSAEPKNHRERKRKKKKMGEKNKQEVSFEGSLPVDRIVSYLRELADGFEKREVPVERGLERVTLIPASSIDLEVKAKVKKRKHQLRLEMEWEEPERTEELKIG